jgi:hypothetical protein
MASLPSAAPGWRVRSPFRRRPSIPTADVGALRRSALRTQLVRIVLALGLVGSLAGAYFVSRGLEVRQGGFLPVGSTGIVVLDLSTSVSEEANRRVAGVIRNAVDSDQPAGFIVFSDSAYELVPPGTRGVDLAPMLRFFVPQHLSRAERHRLMQEGRTGGLATFLDSPWVGAFRGGTKISAGLELARTMLRRDHVTNGSVLLVSDLDYSPLDFAALTDILVRYKTERVPLRIVSLFANPLDRELFKRLTGDNSIVDYRELRSTVGAKAQHEVSGTMPLALIGFGVLCILLLTANELWCGRLAMPRRSHA